MTDIDYVAQVAELLRQHSWKCVDTMGRVTCASDDDEHIYTGIDHEQHQAEVLAAAGLIPVRAEWAVQGRRDIIVVRDLEHAKRFAPYAPEQPIFTRGVTSWEEVSDD